MHAILWCPINCTTFQVYGQVVFMVSYVQLTNLVIVMETLPGLLNECMHGTYQQHHRRTLFSITLWITKEGLETTGYVTSNILYSYGYLSTFFFYATDVWHGTQICYSVLAFQYVSTFFTSNTQYDTWTETDNAFSLLELIKKNITCRKMYMYS